jgi:release factor glutamine methyltransferase
MNESEVLFTEIFRCNRASLYLNQGLTIDKSKSRFIAAVLKRRMLGEPIQYILGKTEFMGITLEVTQDVLIPRPETEILVERAIEFLRQRTSAPAASIKILDLGTGSGNIAIVLAKYLPEAGIDAIDISEEALKIARENARLNKVKISFIQSDLFFTYHLSPITYDLIISNPPYIISSRINNLQKEVQFEPRVALDGGSDGLNFYRRIIKLTPRYLKENGVLILEAGFTQLKDIKNIFQNCGKFEIIDIVKDYNSIDRVVVARLNPKHEIRNPKQIRNSNVLNSKLQF